MQNIISLSHGTKVHVLQVAEILRIESAGSYSVFYMKDKKQYVCCKSLSAVNRYLHTSTSLAEIFYRVHRSYMINLREVNNYKHARGGVIIMSDHAAVTVAVRRKKELLQRLQRLR